MIRRAGRCRLLRLQQTGEDPFGQRRLAPLLQHMKRTGRQQDLARPFLGFRIAHLQRAAGRRVDGAAYLQRSACLLEVAPFESADLAASKTRRDLRVEEVVPQRLVADRFHESVEPLFVEDFHRRFVELRDHRPLRRILHDQPGAHRRFHDLVEQHVDTAHGGVGKLTLASVAGFIRFLTHRVIELLHVPLRNGAQHLAAQRRLDVMTHVTAVPPDGTLAQRRFGVAREPLLDPFRKRHVALLAQIRVAVAVDGAVQLRHQLFLCFGEDGFVDWRSLFLVSDDDTAFPASVLALADEPVAVRSFPCHVSHFLCNTNTYHNTFGISSENRFISEKDDKRRYMTPCFSLIHGRFRRLRHRTAAPSPQIRHRKIIVSESAGKPCAVGVAVRCEPRPAPVYGTASFTCLIFDPSLLALVCGRARRAFFGSSPGL